jgi:hypothetical protein
MTLLHFATETYCALRFKGLPSEVAFVKTHIETMKYNIVSCHKENKIPTEQDLEHLKYIAQDDRFTQNAESTFNNRINRSKLRIVN